jgi:hypothetical protein
LVSHEDILDSPEIVPHYKKLLPHLAVESSNASGVFFHPETKRLDRHDASVA